MKKEISNNSKVGIIISAIALGLSFATLVLNIINKTDPGATITICLCVLTILFSNIAIYKERENK